MVCKRPWERKDLGVRGREIGLGIQMAEGAWLAWMQSEAKVPSCFMQIWQTTAAYNVHQCPVPQSSWKFPQLYRFQSAMSFVSGQPQNLDIVAEIFFLLHIETLQGAGGGGGGGGWITVRRKVLAPAPPPFPSLILWIQPCAQWLCPHPGGFWTVCFCLGGEMIVWGGSDNCHYWWTSHSLCWTPTRSQKKVTDMQGLPTNQQILHAPRPNVIFRTYFPM